MIPRYTSTPAAPWAEADAGPCTLTGLEIHPGTIVAADRNGACLRLAESSAARPRPGEVCLLRLEAAPDGACPPAIPCEIGWLEGHEVGLRFRAVSRINILAMQLALGLGRHHLERAA